MFFEAYESDIYSKFFFNSIKSDALVEAVYILLSLPVNDVFRDLNAPCLEQSSFFILLIYVYDFFDISI